MAYVEQHMVSGLRPVHWMNSILFKIIMIVLVTVLLVVAGTGFMAYRYTENARLDELQSLAGVTANRLSQHLNGPMWAVDYEKVGDMLVAEMKEKRIDGLTVRDEDASSIFAAKRRFGEDGIEDSNGNLRGDFVVAAEDVVRDGKVIGNVEVLLTKKYLAEEMRGFATWLAGSAALLALILTVAIGTTLMFNVVRPIKNLTRSAEHISNGDLKQKIDLDRRDEIGYLASTLDRMQQSLRVAIHRIRNANAKKKASLKVAS